MKGSGFTIEHRDPRKMDEVVRQFIREMHLTAELNTQHIFDAWDRASGAAEYTVARFFRDGTLYVTIGSSVIRSQLYFQKDVILRSLNDILMNDPMFFKDEPKVGFVRSIVLK